MVAGSINKYKKPALTASTYPGLDPRISRALRTGPRRQFPFLLFGVLTVALIAIHGVLDASTGASNRDGSTSFLRWILRSEGKPVQVAPPAQAPSGNSDQKENDAVASRESPASRDRVGMTRGSSRDRVPFGPLTVSQSPTNPLSALKTAPFSVKRQRSILNNRVVIERVKKGDTLSTLLQRRHVPLATVYAVDRGARPVFNLSTGFRPGKLVKLVFNSQRELLAFAYPVENDRTMTVIRKNNGDFIAQLDDEEGVAPPDVEPQRVASPHDSDLKGRFAQATKRVQVEVRRGDYLTGVLARRQISRSTAVKLATATKPVFDLARFLRPGNVLELAIDSDGELVGISYPLDSERTLWVVRNNDGQYVAQIEKKAYDIHLETVSGLVRGDGSLFLAGKYAGLTKEMAVKLAGLFEWDVDFARDIRSGDRFTVIREAKYYDGSRVSEGEIVAAEFINQGHKYRAVRYINPEGNIGYFDPKGRNMRKMFIRAPVDFSRISSGFAKRRKHPVLGFTRAHKGTDFAASTGTPVRASGGGVVVFSGRRGGFGNLVLIRHNHKYTTAYAHLNSIARGLKANQRVRQGQVIGTVGMTGTATGPHLHYEVRVNGKQVDPLTVQLPAAEPVPRKYLSDFRLKTASLLSRLKNESTRVASLPSQTVQR